MVSPPVPRPERHEVRRRKERLIVRASFRPDAQLMSRLRVLSSEAAASWMVGQALTEMGLVNMAQRRRIMVWERKRVFAESQMRAKVPETIHAQFRQQMRTALNELRKEFPDEGELNVFLNRMSDLYDHYAHARKGWK